MNNQAAPQKTSRKKRTFTTREIVIIAVFTAIAAVLSFIEIPIMPAAPWLKYDPSGSVSLISSLVFGPVTGGLVAVLSWVPRLVTNPIGAVMNIFAALGMVIPAGLIYKRHNNMSGAVKGMAVGLVVSIIISVILNFIATPLYFGGSVQDVLKLLLPAIIPFNVLKLLINCGITLLVYKTVSNMVKDEKSAKTKNNK